jgi:hypothetical protein
MKKYATVLAIVALILLIGPFGAQANLVWDWVGDCDGIITPVHGGGSVGCSEQATFHVETTDAYIPGDGFPDPNLLPTFSIQDQVATLLEARYTDENVTFDFLEFGGALWRDNFHGFRLPAVPGDPEGIVTMEAVLFTTGSTGWRFGGENLRPGCDLGIDILCGYTARGINGVWTRVAVPEPATLALLALGFMCIAFASRSRLSDKALPEARP